MFNKLKRWEVVGKTTKKPIKYSVRVAMPLGRAEVVTLEAPNWLHALLVASWQFRFPVKVVRVYSTGNHITYYKEATP